MRPNQFIALLFFTGILIAPLCASADSPIRTKASKGVDPHLQLKIEEAKKSILAEGPRFEMIGLLENGVKTTFSVNGEDFSVLPSTQIEGSLKTGASVQVFGKITSGIKYATQVVVTENVNSSLNIAPSSSSADVER